MSKHASKRDGISTAYTKSRYLLIAFVIIVVAVILPFTVSRYMTFQLTGVLVYAVAALGLNLITGYAGQISLSVNAFFALGAYVSALSMIYFNVHYAVSILIAAVVTFLAGYLAGYPAQRVRGLYLALITLVLAIAVVPLIDHFKAFTGGMTGLSFERPYAPEWTGLNQDVWIYYVVLMFTVPLFYLTRNFVSGSTGRALMGVRLAPLAASSVGVNISGYKVLIFGLGSMLSGIGGALFLLSIGFIAPDTFGLLLSIGFLAAIVVGGLGTIWGALVAGFFLQFIPTYASDLSESLAGLIYGAILIICMFFMPRGVIGSIVQLLNKRKAKTDLLKE